jgi:SAM-dependent methyltransferase
MKIDKPKEVGDYYKKESVVKEYIEKRFTDPLNILEHKKQVKLVNKIIRDTYSSTVLEFAPGPARLTAELKIEGGVSYDLSNNMLRLARKRMRKTGRKWSFKQGNIFDLKLNGRYDLIFSIRFFLHFKKYEREKLYLQVKKFLKKDGYLVIEVMNRNTVLPLRNLVGKNKYFVYDKLYTKHEFIHEMEINGFKVLMLYPILTSFWIQVLLSRPFIFLKMRTIATWLIFFLEKNKSKDPYEWVALCQKK